jgi:hypothetical protein
MRGWWPCSQGSPPRLPHRDHSDCRRACSRESVWIGEEKVGAGCPLVQESPARLTPLEERRSVHGPATARGTWFGTSPERPTKRRARQSRHVPLVFDARLGSMSGGTRPAPAARHYPPGTIRPALSARSPRPGPNPEPQSGLPRPAAPMSVSATVSQVGASGVWQAELGRAGWISDATQPVTADRVGLGHVLFPSVAAANDWPRRTTGCGSEHPRTGVGLASRPGKSPCSGRG